MTNQDVLTPPSPMETGIWQSLERFMPSILRDCGRHLRTEQEKNLYYLSMIVACSALLTRIRGTYHRRTAYLNMIMFGIAPPGSNKSVAMSPRIALQKIHDELIKESSFKMSVYKQQLSMASKSKSNFPERPPIRLLFVLGNVTSSKLIQHLSDNQPYVPTLTIESEIDTIAQSVRSEHGGHSDILRNVFHNEAVNYSRKGGDEFLEVKTPKLAMIVTGTPEQNKRFIGTAENGLFSRILYYYFSGGSGWDDVSPKNDEVNFQDLLSEASDEFLKLWKFYNQRDVTFNLTNCQWDKLNELFGCELERVAPDEYAQGVVKRHGLILFKMAAVLTALRMYELNNSDNYIECLDKDFEIAKELTLQSMDHSMEILEQLPSSPKPIHRNKGKKEEFYNRLSQRFSRGEAILAGQSLKVSPRTLDRWLNHFVSSRKLTMEDYGFYSKPI